MSRNQRSDDAPRAASAVARALGLEEQALDDALAWARHRADELLRSLDDQELRALLHASHGSAPADAAASPSPGAASSSGAAPSPAEPEPVAVAPVPRGRNRRTTERRTLVEPAVVEVQSWSELVTLYTRDISSGGMFVQTTLVPERDAEVAVQLLLPEGAGTLRFEGVVAHVVTAEEAAVAGGIAGFGLQFRGLTPQRRRALRRIIAQAEAAAEDPRVEPPRLEDLGLTSAPDGGGLRLTLDADERRQMKQLRAELEAMGSRGDLELLGLSSADDRAQLRAAFDRLARQWHPSVVHRDAPPEIRALATEIFLRIEQAYQRLSTEPEPELESESELPPEPEPELVPPPPAYSVDGPRPETVIGPAPTAPSRPPRAAASPSGAAAAHRQVGEVVAHGEQLTRTLERPGTTPAARRRLPPEGQRTPIQQVLALVSAKRYAEAIEQLEPLVQAEPRPRMQVLLAMVRARQAIEQRDLALARACYEQALQIDPDNALAKRELLMVASMEG